MRLKQIKKDETKKQLCKQRLEDYKNGKLKTEENCEVTDEESI